MKKFIVKRGDWFWKRHIEGYYYPILPYRPGIRADENLGIYGGDPVTLGTIAIIGAGTAAYGSYQEEKAQDKAMEYAREQEEKAREEQARLEEKYGLTPGELARERRLFGGEAPSETKERRTFEENISKQRQAFEADITQLEQQAEQERIKRELSPTRVQPSDIEAIRDYDAEIRNRRETFEADIKKQQEKFESDITQRISEGYFEREEIGLEERRQTELERRAGLPGEELLREAGPTTRALLDQIASRLGMTSEKLFTTEGGKAAEQLLEQITAPGPTEMFKGELELVKQMVNQEAARRGVFGGLPEGGIRFEQLGRAGVDLAIKSARESIEQRTNLVNTLLNLTAGARQEAGVVSEAALTTQEKARQELDQLLANLQNLTAAAKGREANVALGAAGIAEPALARSYGTITDVYGAEAGAGASLAQTGLDLLAGIGGDIFSEALKPKEKPTGDTLTTLRGEEYDPLEYLGAVTGSAELKKKYPYLLG